MASSKCKGFLKDEESDLEEEHLSEKQGKLTDSDSTSDESDEYPLTTNITELQTHLYLALEKTRQWLEYDQQREAYVRAILARMLWLEKQLNEANQGRLQQHNEDHSDEEDQICQMQEHDEGLLQEAEDKQDVEQYQKKERGVEELKLQLETEKMSRTRAEYEKQQLREETKHLKRRLDAVQHMSANSQELSRIYQEFYLCCRYADQEMIEDLEQQAHFWQQLCLQDHCADQENNADLERQRDQDDGNSCEAAPPPSPSSRGSPTSSPHSSLQNESFLECPSCQARCPTSHYRKLLSHLDNCLDQCLSTFSPPSPSE